MKNILIILLCVLLLAALLSFAFALPRGGSSGGGSSGSSSTPAPAPEGMYIGDYLGTADHESTENIKYVDGGELGYITVGDVTYYFIRFDVSPLERYSIRYYTYADNDDVYPYFSVYHYSINGTTWGLLDELRKDYSGNYSEARGLSGNLEYIYISVYSETNSSDPAATLSAIRAAALSGEAPDTTVYITNVYG